LNICPDYGVEIEFGNDLSAPRTGYRRRNFRNTAMNMNLYMAGPPLISLLAGIAILIWPRLLSYIVAFYLITFGLLGLLALTL